MDIITSLTFDDILLVPQYSDIDSRADVSTKVTDKTGLITLELPIFSSNMDTITEVEMATYIDSKGGAGILHRFMSVKNNIKQYLHSPKSTFVSVGVTEKEKARANALLEVGASKFCIDVAHGNSKSVAQMIYEIKKNKTDAIVMAGNVATYDGAKFLKDSGADLVKVGVGPGSVCSTRVKTGHGVPQLSAIMDCAKVDISIIADGGIRSSGDIVKALAAGADFVMLGSLLAGTEFTPGLVSFIDYKTPTKNYRGMASKEAADDYLGGLSEWKTAEGVSVTVPYKNREATEAIIQDIVGGLRSGLTYSGARTIKELQEKAKWIKITNAGLVESHPHNKGNG